MEVRAALKVLHDSLGSREAPSSAAAAARALVQAEWFRVAGTRDADPHLVEDYLDAFETVSPQVLSTVVNLADNNVSGRGRPLFECGLAGEERCEWECWHLKPEISLQEKTMIR